MGHSPAGLGPLPGYCRAQLRLLPPLPTALPSSSRPSPGSGDQALLRLGVGVPGQGQRGWEPPSRVAPSEPERGNYAGGFMSLCL